MSTRLLSLLTGSPDPSKVKHYLVKDSFDAKTEMAPPRFLVIESGDDATGAMLYRFDAEGGCISDTWHTSIEDAKAQAAYEYEAFVHGWHEIPAEIEEAAQYGVARVELETDSKQ